VCKRPTTVTWEPGSTTYVRQDLNSIDPAMLNTSGTISNVYRRIIMKDVNNDGRDDLIYRQYVSSSTSSTGQRLGWRVRLNTTSGSTVSFGNPITLAGAEYVDPDPANKYPYSGDVIFGDVTVDDYPDFFLASGNNGPLTGPNAALAPVNSNMNGYFLWQQFCSLPGGLPNCGFGSVVNPPIDGHSNVDDAGAVDPHSPVFALGDVTGDGFPEFIRPRVDTNAGVHWRTAVTGTIVGDVFRPNGPFEV